MLECYFYLSERGGLRRFFLFVVVVVVGGGGRTSYCSLWHSGREASIPSISY